MNDPCKLNWFTSKIVTHKTSTEEEYSYKLHSKIYDIIFRKLYYKNIYNPIVYNIIWPLKYNKKLRDMIKKFRIHNSLINRFFYIEFYTCPSYRPKFIKNQNNMAKYELIEVRAPDIVFGAPIVDPGVGGIKLKYSKSKEYSLTKKDVKDVIFLKPYKKNWATNKKDCKKGEWGNTRSPFANVWLELPEDYTNYEESYEIILLSSTKVTDSKLIKNLNNKVGKFTIKESTDEPITSLKKKILFNLGLLYLNIKDRIINQKSKKR